MTTSTENDTKKKMIAPKKSNRCKLFLHFLIIHIRYHLYNDEQSILQITINQILILKNIHTVINNRWQCNFRMLLFYWPYDHFLETIWYLILWIAIWIATFSIGILRRNTKFSCFLRKTLTIFDRTMMTQIWENGKNVESRMLLQWILTILLCKTTLIINFGRSSYYFVVFKTSMNQYFSGT